MAITQLPVERRRGGGVKARRPRASAVGAKRRALHAAEHSASIECVMANRHPLSVDARLRRTPGTNKILREIFPHDLRADQSAWRRSFLRTNVTQIADDER
jgi:hypothetical protein